MSDDVFRNLFEEIYKGDKRAIQLSFDVLAYVHLWDDLIDRDKPVSDHTINRTLLAGITRISCSPLWDTGMAAIVESAYYRWHFANVVEKNVDSTDNDIAKAWIHRSSCYDVFVAIALRLYGHEWAEKASVLVYASYGETLLNFTNEVRNA